MACRGIPDEFVDLPGAFTALGAARRARHAVAGVGCGDCPSDGQVLRAAHGRSAFTANGLEAGAAVAAPATNVDLANYASVAARQGRIESRHVADIEEELSEAALTRSRNAAAIDWIAPSGGTRSVGQKTKSSNASPLARPYAHPYFWAGFICTGL